MANNRRSRRRGSGRRGGTGFYVFAALVVLALGALAYVGGSSIIDTTLRADSDSVQRAEDPTGAEAPEVVEEVSTEEEPTEEKSTEEKSTEEKSTEEKSTEEKSAEEKSAEEKSTEEPSEEEIAAAEEADTETAEEAAAEEEAVEEEVALEEELPTEEGLPEEEEDEVAVAPGDATMYLSVPKLGINGAIVADGEAGLELGAMHLAGTGYPWQSGSNTYVAGHRVGFPGTGSDRIFYDLPNMAAGDTVTLTDSLGQEYDYVVSEMFAVTPFDVWVTAPTGEDMVTLQVCTESPDDWFTIGPKLMDSGPESGRLIVRAVKA